MTRKFVWFNGFLVLAISITSFGLSYFALRDLSLEYLYLTYPQLSYFWPLLLDFSLVVFSSSIVVAKIQNDSVLKHWLLVIMYTLATIIFNVIHAPNDILSKVLSAIPPISLFFSFEVFLHQLVAYELLGKKKVIEEEGKPFPTKKITGLDRFRKDKRKKVEKLISLLDENLDKPEIIKKLKVTPQTYDSYLLELQEMGYTNGRIKVQA